MSKLERLKNACATALTALQEVYNSVDNLPDDLTEDEQVDVQVRLIRFAQQVQKTLEGKE